MSRLWPQPARILALIWLPLQCALAWVPTLLRLQPRRRRWQSGTLSWAPDLPVSDPGSALGSGLVRPQAQV